MKSGSSFTAHEYSYKMTRQGGNMNWSLADSASPSQTSTQWQRACYPISTWMYMMWYIYIYMLIPHVPCQLNVLHSAGNILASDPKGVCPASFLVERVISLLVAEPGSCAWWCAFGSTVGVCTGANQLHGSFELWWPWRVSPLFQRWGWGRQGVPSLEDLGSKQAVDAG